MSEKPHSPESGKQKSSEFLKKVNEELGPWSIGVLSGFLAKNWLLPVLGVTGPFGLFFGTIAAGIAGRHLAKQSEK